MSDEKVDVCEDDGCKRVGLVLENGGAKGAFQFGCLQALSERGIVFDVYVADLGPWNKGHLVPVSL